MTPVDIWPFFLVLACSLLVALSFNRLFKTACLQESRIADLTRRVYELEGRPAHVCSADEALIS